MTEKKIRIERTYSEGVVRPLGRGIVLGPNREYLDDIIGYALEDEGVYSSSGGSTLTNIHIIIEIEKAEKR